MSEEAVNTKRRGRLLKQAIVGVLLLVGFVSTAWYLTSDHFRDRVRAKLVTRLEDMTGGRVEMKDFHWNLSKLEFDIRDVTIHGTEGPDEVPYAHADHLLIRLKVLSVLERNVGLRWLQVDRPVIHIIVYPDGHTNQPVPRVVEKNSGSAIQRVFDLAMNHAEVNNGLLIVNERKMPLDFSADNVKATMDHASGANRYDGKVSLTSAHARYAKFLPADATAEFEFSLLKDRLEITGLHVLSGNSKLDASGSVTSFEKLNIDATYRATLNAGELAKVTGLREIRRGIIDINGAAHYDTANFTSKGKLVVHDGEYRDGGFPLPDVDGAADFIVDEHKLTLTKLVARTYGGIFKGEIVVTDWAGAPVNGKPAPPQTGVAHLKIETLPVGTVAKVFSTKELNFSRLNLVGTGSGTLNGRWRGNVARAVADLNLDVVPPSQAREGEMPVTADVKGTVEFATGRFEFDRLNVVLPDLTLEAAGTLGSTHENLRMTLAVKDLSRVQPVLSIINQQNGTLGQLSGTLDFNGTLSGKLSTPDVQGHLAVSDFTFPLSAVTAMRQIAGPERIHLDQGSADISLNQQNLTVHNGMVKRAGAQANFELSAGLVKGNLVDASPLTAHLVIHDASFADLQQVAGYNYPVTGTVAATLDVFGTKGSPQGGGHVSLTNGSAYGEPVKSASADIRFEEQEARVQNLVVVHNGARITGSGSYNLRTAAFRFQATGTNFQLATLRRLNTGKMSLSGLVNFTATGSGTTTLPVINMSARLQNLYVNGQRVGDATFTGITQGDTLRLTGRSNFQNAELTTDGTVKVREAMFPANITVRFTNFDFMPFLQTALQGRISGKSFVDGSITIQGPLKEPKDLTIVAEIPTLRAELQGMQVHNSEPVKLSMLNQVVHIDSFKLLGTDTEMDARGTVNLAGERRVRVRANGRLNLAIAQSFNPDLNSAGLADFDVNFSGNLPRPAMQGELKIINGSVNLIDFPNGLSNVNGTVLFTEDRVQVQSLVAHTGGGDIQITGYATTMPQLTFNLAATGQGIRLRYPQGVSSTANVDLKLAGTLNNSTLSGEVTVTKFGFNDQFDLAVYIAKSSKPSETPRASPLNNLHMNVHVVSTPELQVQSSLAKLAGNVDLNVRGVASNPVVLGRVNLTEGKISLNGQTYELERGDVTFSNPTKTEPTIDIRATTRVRDYDLTLQFAGQPTHGLKPTFRSDPPLPEADIINLMAFGRTREESEIAAQQGSSTMTENVSNAVLGQAINSQFSDRVQKLFGVSRIKIAPEVGSTTTNPTAQVTVEQQVSNKVTITYVTNLAVASQQSIFVEYNINRDISLIAGRDQYGVVSFDVRVRQRKR